ncbi:hypothetical protein [Methanococcoides burtonii]|uniref:PepSY domain-containing protein n=1 Tax=Methanococcoides burtonii (strain DSM 6242 / NBRC 107633 / OCM 468 / ACE-M) TaxID=259564 RepID=Q12ZE8_METBU|nr:hypothetical protein [Methanococcoides burtonii]ABE51178.1 Hypothetical protein Mbur_0167 [Methanococcoides burtonii DSM 6242]
MKYSNVLIVLSVILLTVAMSFAAESFGTIYEDNNVKNSKYVDASDKALTLTLEKAKEQMKSENPDVLENSITGGLVEDDIFGYIWMFTSKNLDGGAVLSGIDPYNGDTIYVYKELKSRLNIETPTPISSKEANEIANDYLEKKSNIDGTIFSSVIFHSSTGENLPATYAVHYDRVINGINSLSDGIILNLDAETGEVVSYRKRWKMPESQVMKIDTKPSLSEEEIGKILNKHMSSWTPLSKNDDVEIQSMDLFWIDYNYRENQVHDIHLIQRVKFIDSIRNEEPIPIAWIDVHSGEVLSVQYELG